MSPVMDSAIAEVYDHIPTIDFGRLGDPEQRSKVCEEVAKACETVGFFEIANSGIPLDVLDEGFDVSRRFYDLSKDEKMTLWQDLQDKTPAVAVFQLGYKHYPVMRSIENRMEEMVFRHYRLSTASQTDSITVGEKETKKTNPSATAGETDPTENWWPTNPVDYRVKIERLSAELGKVADTLLDVFSESLGLPSTYLREVHHKNNTVPRYLNMHHYPKGTIVDEDEVGIMPHRDSSVFTIVCQGYDTSGLFINPYGKWIAARPRRGGLIINVGDILQTWSNGRYRSILHKVVSNKKLGRHSLAYFLFPSPGPEADYIVEPIPKLINEKNPLKYRPFSYLDFFKNKMEINSISMLQSHLIQT